MLEQMPIILGMQQLPLSLELKELVYVELSICFFEEDRIPAVREMILSNTEEQRLISLEKLLPMQIDDFVKIFEVMEGRPVNIRLLDPPLHEFLPSDDETIEEQAKSMNIETNDIKKGSI